MTTLPVVTFRSMATAGGAVARLVWDAATLVGGMLGRLVVRLPRQELVELGCRLVPRLAELSDGAGDSDHEAMAAGPRARSPPCQARGMR